MKIQFLSAFVVVAAATFHTASAVKLVEKFLSKEEIDYFLETDFKDRDLQGQRSMGRKLAEADLARRLRAEAGQDFGRVFLESEAFDIPITHVHKSTDVHLDNRAEIEEDVAIAFLNTNKDAFFAVGEERIPAFAGNLVIFKGGEEKHNTVVQQGEVLLLGPVTLYHGRRALVPEPTPVPTPAPTPAPTSKPTPKPGHYSPKSGKSTSPKQGKSHSPQAKAGKSHKPT